MCNCEECRFMAELRKRIAACDVEWIQGVVAAARMDLEHANSIIDGSWPDADEIIAEIKIAIRVVQGRPEVITLGLNGSGYATVVACALGYRAAGDKYANLAKVRYPAQDLVRVV